MHKFKAKTVGALLLLGLFCSIKVNAANLNLQVKTANVNIQVVEPIKNGTIVFQKISPKYSTENEQGRVSLKLKIKNNETTALTVDRIMIDETKVSRLPKPLVIPAGRYKFFQNCNCKVKVNGVKTPNSVPYIITAPFPTELKVSVYFVGYAVPVQITVPIVPGVQDNSAFVWAGKANDLLDNQLWSSSSNHAGGRQAFALDTGIRQWVGDGWSHFYPGADKDKNTANFTYGAPIYAMSDGNVCWALNDHTERADIPTDARSTTGSASNNGKYFNGGNQIYVKTGNEITLYAHLQKGSIPAELLTKGVPIKKGQYLGKVGMSGSTSGPHYHVHIKTAKNGNNCDAGKYRPMVFTDMQSINLEEAHNQALSNTLSANLWFNMINHSVPHVLSALYPTTSAFNFCASCEDKKQYLGVWRKASHIELRVKRRGWKIFVRKWKELSRDKFRLTDISTITENGKRYFVGIFNRGKGKHYLWRAKGWKSLTRKWARLSKKGFRLIDVTTYKQGNSRFYIGVFRSGNYGYGLIGTPGWGNFKKINAKLYKQGYRLIDIEGHHDNGTDSYIGVFRRAKYKQVVIYNNRWTGFTREWRRLSRQRLRLVDIAVFKSGSQLNFVGVFNKGGGKHAFASVNSYAKFVQLAESLRAKGLRLLDLSIEQ